MTIQVSVIIPVYNSENYIREAIESVQAQTLERGAIEMIIVDDGSTDDSGKILEEMAGTDSRITLISQENSGTPGGGRNPAIGRAVGEFVFFLDSDDLLTPDALRRMVEAAQSEESDVVLGKMVSSNGRHVPGSMFKRTVMDAHLIDDNVFNTLGPWKLIRKSIIDRLELRFPDDQKSGEDQPFVAAVYLNARKISVLADMDYYVLQYRDDGTNVTSSGRSAREHMLTAVRLAQVIEKYTEPGEYRNSLLRRPFAWSGSRVVDSRWAALERADKEELAEMFQRELGSLYSCEVRKSLNVDLRVKFDLLNAGEVDAVDVFAEYLSDPSTHEVVWADGQFRRRLPESMAQLIAPDAQVVAEPKTVCRLEEVAVSGLRVSVSASVRIPSLKGAPDRIGIRARLRHTEQIEDFRVVRDELSPTAPSFAVTAEHDGLARGVWDLFVVLRYDDFEREYRFGSNRAQSIEPEGVSNLVDDPVPQDRVIAYFTQGPGNLSIDRGGVIGRNVALARSLGLTLDEDGRALMLVETTRKPHLGDEYFCYIAGVRQHTGRQLLPSVRLGDRLVGLRLPDAAQLMGATITVVSVLGGTRSALPIVGAEFWPARAAGFELVATRDGAARVTSTSSRGFSDSRSVLPSVPLAGKARNRATADVIGRRGLRQSAVAAFKSIPVLGRVLTFAVRSTRRVLR